MFRTLSTLALVVCLASPTWALTFWNPTDQEETITVSTSAVGITSSICNRGSPRDAAIIEVLTNSIFFSLHSATATPDSGDFGATAGDKIQLSPSEVVKLRMIRDGGSDATVKVQCYAN